MDYTKFIEKYFVGMDKESKNKLTEDDLRVLKPFLLAVMKYPLQYEQDKEMIDDYFKLGL